MSKSTPPTDTETAPTEPAATEPVSATENPQQEARPAEPEEPEPGVYEFTAESPCVYPHVPLTCRPAAPESPATVFDWPEGPPADGRWTKTRKKPNQQPDNAPAPSGKE
ncbi:hypothetical protein [Streptomyces sp. NPDC050738]|uniref:hypothetical protein n=1 Tax=Streptomyces sp. NPDC050738 TaxID=3154744 RepID=UPI003432EE4F